MTTFLIAAIALLSAAAETPQQNPATCPMHAAHAGQKKAPAPTADAHAGHAEMEARGTVAMGFDQSRATHRFVLTADGGYIEIAANAADDAEVTEQITTHLEEIARLFKAGDFGIPLATHGELPPGASQMAVLRDAIAYRFEPVPQGGRVVISAASAQALEAVHAFLRYQIVEHRTR